MTGILGPELKEVTKKGGIQALKNMLVSTPFGTGAGGVCVARKKGSRIIDITRRARSSIFPLTMLYGLYIMAEKAQRNVFTVRGMLSADPDDTAVSPIAAFGIAPEEFKKQCMGLTASHPDFIGCSFTLGLDEVVVKADLKTRDDVIGLILEA